MTLLPCVLCGQPDAQAVLCSACLARYPGQAQLPFIPPGWRVVDIEGCEVWFGPGAGLGPRRGDDAA